MEAGAGLVLGVVLGVGNGVGWHDEPMRNLLCLGGAFGHLTRLGHLALATERVSVLVGGGWKKGIKGESKQGRVA